MNYLPTGINGKLKGGVLINATANNYWAKSTLHIHSSFAEETTPKIIKSLTLSTSGSGDEGDGIGVDFEFPSQSNITNLAASIDVVKTSDVDNNTSAKMIISTTGNDETKNQALTIDDDGSVGVGTTAPVANLHVNGSSTLGKLLISPSSTVNNDSELFLAEDNDGTYGMHIIYDGSENELQIGGKNNINVYGPHLRISRNDPNVAIGGAIDPAYALRVYGNLRTNGIDELSDERWKKDVVKIEDALQKVLAMKGVYYNWRTEDFPENKFSDKHQVGFIAQELEKILPEVVSTDNNGYKSVMYGHVVALLVEAIKDLESQLVEKTTSLEEKTKEIDEIKASLDEIQRVLGINKDEVKR